MHRDEQLNATALKPRTAKNKFSNFIIKLILKRGQIKQRFAKT